MSISLVDRIKLLIEDKELSPSAFADAIDIQRSSISHILSGRNNPSLDIVQKILNKYPNINSAWLLTGRGKMKQLDLFESENEKKVTEATSVITAPPVVSKAAPIKEFERVEQPSFSEPPKITPVGESIIPPPTVKENYTPYTAPPMPEKKPAQTEVTKPPILISGDKQIEQIFVFYTDKTFSVYKPE